MNNPDFITAFKEWCGETECPDDYLTWGALSLLAVSCGNHIYTKRRFGNIELPVVPNLYLILLGPSANYKSFAMDRVLDVVKSTNYTTSFSLFAGHVTAAGMIDCMNSEHWQTDAKTGKRYKETRPWNRHMYLLNDELAACAGSAEFADLFVRQLTKMYFGTLFDDVTRTSGRIKIENFTVNWFASSTADWLVRSLNPDSMDAGFFRRAIMVNCTYSGKRIWEPTQSRNADSLFAYLSNRVEELLVTHQCLAMTVDAKRVMQHWYLSQEPPHLDDRLGSSSRDQASLILKLSLLLAVSGHSLEITDEHIAVAITMADQTLKWKKEIMPQMLRGSRGKTEEDLMAWLRARKQAPRHILSKMAYDKYHIKVNELNQLIATWIQSDLIEVRTLAPNKGGTLYVARPER